jgi:malonyl-CoA decarboxylase
MKRYWLEKFLEQIADRGRELLHLRTEEAAVPHLGPLCRALLSGVGEAPVDALMALLARADAPRAVLAEPLKRLALAYLSLLPREPDVFDPVARFHLANGARLERINVFADESAARVEESFSVMVNYLYDSDEVIANHEGFVGSGHVAFPATRAKEARDGLEWRRDGRIASRFLFFVARTRHPTEPARTWRSLPY